ncbi:MAG TPA: DNA polymerase Y family protein [Lamprocystis sp. (in: g-proteobacteria)]|nr:DNA polymerase Y family protein [Lamprocystis sp. (in: g-proteobacteria)]
MRWLAIHLPHLPLEVFARARVAQTPLAISSTGQGEHILRCNPAATACGIRPGQGVGAARALCTELTVIPQRPALEQETVARLAAWSIRFTPQVSLAPPRALLLDVAASLNLFGGAAALLDLVGEGVAGLGYQGRLALAPTPLGALVWAMQTATDAPAAGRIIPDRPALRAALNGLPLATLGLRPREVADLTAMGLRRVADLLRLPRQGLRERLGPRRVDWLERLLGEAPDPRPAFTPPADYQGRIELPTEVDLTESLIFPCRRLLAELGGFLLGRQAGVLRLDWRLVHPDGAATCFQVGAARPLADTGPWLELLRGHLERLELPAPVREIALSASDVRPLSPRPGDLFPDLPPPGRVPETALLDRLRARLGRDAVRGLALAVDHRPERAWCWVEPGATGSGMPRLDRPLWLLPQAQPLEERDGRPWLDGALDLGRERERIDTGWWDDQPVARDYFIATSPHGERLWIYRELKGARNWYLHGRFV